MGFENIELCSQLIEKRELIKEQCKSIEENISKQKIQNRTNTTQNMDFGNRGGVGVSVEFVTGKGGKKKGKPQTLAAQSGKQNVSNYDILESLGFSKDLIGENKRLGLKERTEKNLNAYLWQHQNEVASGAVSVI